MRYLMLYAIAIFLTSCSSNSYKRQRFTYSPSEKQIWIDSYKYEVYFGCINEGLENDSLRIILKSRDLYSKNAEIDFKVIDDARRYGKYIIKQMPDANIKIDNDQQHLRDNNFISYNCLVYYASLQLDSIANIAYKDYIKSKN